MRSFVFDFSYISGTCRRFGDVDVTFVDLFGWVGTVLVAAEAPRGQMLYGTSWLTGWVSGNHRAHVA